MGAAKEKIRWLGVLRKQSFAHQPPAFREVVLRPGKLEVVHVADEKQAQTRVRVARRPVRHRNKTGRDEGLLAVILPEGPAIGMSVERLLKETDRLLDVGPRSRSEVLG